jgi:phytoene synthase
MTWTVEASYAHCRTLARRAATNFYLSFFTLPKAKRQAMYALYAFLRRTDDLGDNAEPLETRRAALMQWRTSLERSLAGEFDSPLFPALADTVARYDIPPEYLFAAIDGVEMDLNGGYYETFDDLCSYCHKVASVVGLACIHIWGFRGPEALEPARKCGIAFQITNILRDLKEDAATGRVYLPQQDLHRFKYSNDDLRNGIRDGRFRALMHFEIERTESLYREAAELARWLEPDGRKVFTAMVGIYRGLLDEIKRRDGDVFSSRVRLSTWHKLRIAGNALLARTPVPRCAKRPGADAP